MDVRLLGPVEAATTAGVIRVGSLKQRALLAMLALQPGHLVPTELLVGGLWGDEPPADAEGSLRFHVARLRKLLGSQRTVLLTHRGGYELAVTEGEVDVGRFEQLVRQSRRDGDERSPIRGLEEALALWRGPALADVADEPFAAPVARRLEELRSDAEEELQAARLAAGSANLVVADLERLVAAQPLRERRWELLMEALYQSGRQAEALHAYQRVRRQLADGLGLEPSPRLRELEARILAHDPSLQAPTSEAAGPAPRTSASPARRRSSQVTLPPALHIAERGPVVGRDQPLATLGAAWAAASAGERRSVLVAGEPGIGKSRLARELARSVARGGGRVLWGACDEELEVALLPLRFALSGPVAEHHALLKAAGPALARLLPELLDQGEQATAPDPTRYDGDRLELFRSVERALVALAQSAPVLLVIEDLHWADQVTTSLLRFLLRQPAADRILVVGTYRDTDVKANAPAAGWLADSRGLPWTDHVYLHGLTAEAVVELVDDRSSGAGNDVALALAQHTGGNPLFVHHLLDHLVEAAPGGGLSSLRLPELALPGAVKDLVARRLGRLSATAQRVLLVAAVVGSDFDADVVEAAVQPDLDTDVVLDGLEEGLVARLVREQPGQPGRLAFVHAVVRQAVLDRISQARRVRIHRQVADLLADRPGVTPAVVAHHACQGASVDRLDMMVHWVRLAIEDARSRLAAEEVMVLCERALAVLEAADPTRRRDRALLELERYWAGYRGDQTAPVMHDIDLEPIRASGDGPLLAQGINARLYLASSEDGERLLEEGLAALGSEYPELSSRLTSTWSWRCHDDDLARASAEVARCSGDLAARAWTLSNCLLTQKGWPDLDALEATAEEYEQVAEALRRPGHEPLWRRLDMAVWEFDPAEFLPATARVDMLATRGLIYLRRGDRDRFCRDLEELDRIGHRAEDWGFFQPVGRAWSGMLALIDGRAEAVASAMDDLERLGSPYARALLRSLRQRWRWLTEGPIGLEHEFRALAARPFVPVHEWLTPRTTWRLRAAIAEAEQGRPEPACVLLDQLVADLPGSIPRTLERPAVLAAAAEAAVHARHGSAARSLRPLLEPYSGQLLVEHAGVWSPGAADRSLALLDSVLGDHARAAERFRRAVALEERIGAEVLVVQSRLWWAEHLLVIRPPDPPATRALLDDAARTVERLGLGGLAPRVAELEARLRLGGSGQQCGNPEPRPRWGRDRR